MTYYPQVLTGLFRADKHAVLISPNPLSPLAAHRALTTGGTGAAP